VQISCGDEMKDEVVQIGAAPASDTLETMEING
jgi:hypothetical protein